MDPAPEIPDQDLASFTLERARRARRQAGADRRPERPHDHLRGARRAARERWPARSPRGGSARATSSRSTCRTCPSTRSSSTACSGPDATNTTANPLYTSHELGHQLARLGREDAVHDPGRSSRRPKAAAGAAGLEEIFVVGEADGDETDAWPSCSTRAASRPRSTSIPRDDLAVLPYSSGTTGLPKGVMLTHRNLVANVLQTDGTIPVDDDDVSIGVLPFFHIYGMTVIMNLGLRNGGTIVTMPRFDLEAVPRADRGAPGHDRLRRAADRARAGQAPRRRGPRPLLAADDHVGRRAARRRAGTRRRRPRRRADDPGLRDDRAQPRHPRRARSTARRAARSGRRWPGPSAGSSIPRPARTPSAASSGSAARR